MASHPVELRLAREPFDAVVAFARFAERNNLRWYVFGAQAVAIYGVPRTTGDIDITLDPGADGLDALVAPLRRAGFVPRISDPSFALETQIYPVTHEATGWNLDIVLAGPGLEQRFLDEVRIIREGRHRVPVIALEHLVTLKILAGRPKDLEDIRGLLRVADLDHARVEQTLAELEAMLDQSDLRPVYARLRAEQPPRAPDAEPARPVRPRATGAKRRVR
jgi:hypothetical protein